MRRIAGMDWLYALLLAPCLMWNLLPGRPVAAQQGESANELNVEVTRLLAARKYSEAMGPAKRDLAAAEEKFGKQHPRLVSTLDTLAFIYYELGVFDEAEPLLARSLGIVEASFGNDHPEFSASLIRLATLREAQNRFEDSELLIKRSSEPLRGFRVANQA